MAKKKQNTQIIRHLGDLVELVNHNSDILDGSIKKLAKKNRKLNFLCLVAIGVAAYAVVENRKQEEKVYQLSVKVKKLENSEGATTM